MGFTDTALGEFLKRVSSLNEDIVKRNAYTDSVLDQMVDLNLQQLDDGLYSDGTDTPDYAPSTSQIKRSQNKQSEYMNFDDTGKTRDSIEYRFDGRLTAYMDDEHNLLNEYSKNILGLTPQSISDVQEEIKENIIEQFKP